MVQAKPEMRQRARELRGEGKTYDEIVAELGVSKSSVSLWVRDLPKPDCPARRTEHARAVAEARWTRHRRERNVERQQTKLGAARDIGRLTDRELFLVGVGLYWSEGAKCKPHQPSERVIFVNSDADMIRLYLAWLRLLGIASERLRFSLMIHESADTEAALNHWADATGAPVSKFLKTTLKKHNPKTTRKNVGEGYHGCLRVRVLDSADLYRRIEGWWYGIVVGANSTI
ncbi:hypothetical protein [Streptomyces sp. NPDC047108]|uniref:hypothetical protein n=1 Tax=Streptomyces sp. NPDC047108 TaxID=3155025 RepID=UPI0033E4D7EE